MTEETKAEEKGLSAKDVSLKTMIIASVWIGVFTLLKAFWGLITGKAFGLSIEEIIISGFAISAVYSPVFLSIIFDKIKEIKISK